MPLCSARAKKARFSSDNPMFCAISTAGKTSTAAASESRHLENELAEKLGTKVVVKADKRGRGSVTIHFHSLEQLEGILEICRLK